MERAAHRVASVMSVRPAMRSAPMARFLSAATAETSRPRRPVTCRSMRKTWLTCGERQTFGGWQDLDGAGFSLSGCPQARRRSVPSECVSGGYTRLRARWPIGKEGSCDVRRLFQERGS